MDEDDLEDGALDAGPMFSSAYAAPSEVFDVFASQSLHAVAVIYDRAKPICVFFEAGDFGAPSGAGFAMKYRVNALLIASRNKDWFQYPELDEALDRMRDVAGAFGRTIVTGASQGGFAALHASHRLGADAVVAFAPQSSLGPQAPPRETRWGDDWARIGATAGLLHNDMATGITRSGRVIVCYDPIDPDRHHVEALSAIRPIERIHVPFSGHACAVVLASAGMSSVLLNGVIDGSLDIDDYRRRLAAKLRANGRVGRLVVAMRRRGKAAPRWLLRAFADDAQPLSTADLRFALAAAVEQGFEAEAADFIRRLLAVDADRDTVIADVSKFASAISTPATAAALCSAFTDASRGFHVSSRLAAAPLLAAARLALIAGERSRAVDLARTASLRLSVWNDLSADLAALFADLELADEAAMYARRAAHASSMKFMSVRLSASTALRAGDLHGAARIWRHALEIGVDPLRVSDELARALMRIEDFAGALAALEPALAIAQPSAGVLTMRGDLLVKLGRPNEAMADYERAVKASPFYLQAHRALSSLYATSGPIDKAIHHAERALALSPSNAGIKRNLEKLRALKTQTGG